MKNKKIKKNNGGFVLLFAIMLSSIILAITLGIASISSREIKFGTDAVKTNNALFSADTGAECALYNDKTTSNVFVLSGGSSTVECMGNNFALSQSFSTWSFVVSGLGSNRQGCARVLVDKSVANTATVTSKGYNNGGSQFDSCTPGADSVERVLQLNY